MTPRHTTRSAFSLFTLVVFALSLVQFPRVAYAQAQVHPTPVTRAEAVASALEHGARLGVARADTVAALAQLLSARGLPNPVLATSYSASAPRYHIDLEIPFELPGLRGNRIGSAQAERLAAQYRFSFERAAAALDADTTYTRALAALEHARLSHRTAQDADSLRRIAIARRDAGDASDMDVELATISAGQAANVAAADSLAFLSAVLDLQAVMGLESGEVVVMPADSLSISEAERVADAAVGADMPGAVVSGAGDTSAAGAPLQIAAASEALRSATLGLRAQRHSVFSAPSLSVGFETGDSSGDETGILPTFGIAIPLPLFNRNRGGIVQAQAEELRARAELALVTVENRTAVARVRRELSTALAKVERDSRLTASAERLVSMSLTAYREGASPLVNVLESQRNAREVLGQHVDDTASALVAAAQLRMLTLTDPSIPRR